MILSMILKVMMARKKNKSLAHLRKSFVACVESSTLVGRRPVDVNYEYNS